MKTLWITYSWEDNKNGDIQFIAQELEKNGINVKLDMLNIQAGNRLWEQIDKFISNDRESDAWAIIATQNSLGSEPCKEEIAIALDRALSGRGSSFPLIGIFPSTVNPELIPSVIKTRLYVSLTDDNWIERIVSAVENRTLNIPKTNLDPYFVELKKSHLGTNVIEIRPRAGSWAPFYVAIPVDEKDKVDFHMIRNGKNNIPKGGSFHGFDSYSVDMDWWVKTSRDEATPSMSFYVFCKDLPSKIGFGVEGSKNQYLIEIKNKG